VPPEIIKDRLAQIEIPADLIKDRIENVQIPSDLIKNRLESVEIPGSLIREKLDQVEIPHDIFSTRFDALMNQLQTIVTAVADRVTRDTEAIKQLGTLLNAAVESADKLKLAITTVRTEDERRREELNAGVEALTSALKSVKTTTDQLANMTHGYVDEQKARFNELAASAAHMHKTIEGHRQQLERELASSTAAVGQVHGSLVSLTRTVVENVNGRA
jgi:ABC-type transporter Mla subunit MlaD